MSIFIKLLNKNYLMESIFFLEKIQPAGSDI